MTPAAASCAERSYCCCAHFRFASCAAVLACWLRTVASCFSGSICISGSPAFTRSPEWTKMLVIEPSTCGLMLADCRDLSVATYSDESVTGCGLIRSTFTRIAGGGPCGPFGFELQLHSAAAAATIRASDITAPDLPKLKVLL